MSDNHLNEHLKAGYDNCQNTIKFVDTKANIVMGLAIFVMGAAIKIFSIGFLSNEAPYVLVSKQGDMCYSGMLGSFITGLILTYGLLVIFNSMLVFTPRCPKTMSTHKTVLFPWYSNKEEA